MKNRETEFLSEVRELISDLRQRIECLEKMVAEYEQGLDSEDIDIEPIDLDIEEPEAIGDLPEEIYGDPEAEKEPEPGPEPEQVTKEETETETEPEPGPEQEPVEEEEPEAEPVEEAGDNLVIEDNRQLWWTDMPGSPVRDIRSAISLNDRILYINTLFNEDPMIFQDAVNAINGMNSLREVVGYVKERFPQWNLDSETVYRFMMAARRRVR